MCCSLEKRGDGDRQTERQTDRETDRDRPGFKGPFGLLRSRRTKKRNFFVLDPIILEFKLDLDNIDDLFPIDFQHPRTKKSKVTFFLRNPGIFVTQFPNI